jgi:excisionase family DNA binding protein
MSSNPFESIDTRLSNIENKIENIFLNFNNKPKETENKLYSVKSLASHSGVHELTIRNWISEGKIQAKRIGRRLFIEQNQFEKGLQEVKSLKYKR